MRTAAVTFYSAALVLAFSCGESLLIDGIANAKVRYKRDLSTSDTKTQALVYPKLNATFVSDKRERRNVVLSPVTDKLPEEGLSFDLSDSQTDKGQISIAVTNCSVFRKPTEAAFKDQHILLMVFQTNSDGLLWAYESDKDASKSYVYMQGGKLNVVSVGPDGTSREAHSMTIRGEMFEQGFSSNVVMQLTFVVTGARNLEVYLGDTLALSVRFRRVPIMLINAYGKLTLGVAVNTAELTDNDISTDFVGTIYNVHLFFEAPLDSVLPSEELPGERQNSTDKPFSTVAIQQQFGLRVLELWPYLQDDTAHVTSNIDKGGIRWISVVTAIIGSTHVHEIEPIVSANVSVVLPSGNPATFYGAQAAMRIVARAKSKLHFDLDLSVGQRLLLEFGLLSYDQTGVVMFKGGERRAFFCFEMFDGYLYLVYNLETSVTNRTQVCSKPIGDAARSNLENLRGTDRRNANSTISSFGEVHIAMRISRPTRPRILIEVSCDYNNDGKADDQTELVAVSTAQSFGNFLYVGGVDDLLRLPWMVWSRNYLNGALTYLKLNKQLVMYESFFGQHSNAGVKLGVVDVSDYCSYSDWCLLNETGRCLAGRPFVTGNTYRCDCSHLNRVAKTCAQFPVVYNFSDAFFEIGLPTVARSHVDQLSISFKSSQNCEGACSRGISGLSGGALLKIFRLTSQNEMQRFKLLEVRLRNGEAQVGVIINSTDKEPAVAMNYNLYNYTNTRLNDNNWHVLLYKRRANNLTIWIDQELVYQGLIPGNGYEMIVTHFGIGCATNGAKACEPDSLFRGAMRNVIFNDIDILGLLSSSQESSSLSDTNIASGSEIPGIVVQNIRPASQEGGDGAVTVPTRLFDSFTLVGQANSLIELSVRDLPTAAAMRENSWTSFAFRTSNADGLLFYQRPRVADSGDYLKVELIGGKLHVGVRVSQPAAPFFRSASPFAPLRIVFTDLQALNDGEEHLVTLTVTQHAVNVTVDSAFQTALFDSPFDTLPDALFYEAVVSFGALSDVAAWQRANDAKLISTPSNVYFQGCFSSITVNQDRIDFATVSAFNVYAGADRVVKRGCTDAYTLLCSEISCANGGVCVQLPDANANCVCSNTGYVGSRCTQQPSGYYFGPSGQVGGYVLDPFSVTPYNRPADAISFGLLTQYPNGTIFRIESTDARRWFTVSLVNCALRVTYVNRRANSSNSILIDAEQTGSFCDAQYNVVKLNRTGNLVTLTFRRGIEVATYGPFEFATLSALFAATTYKVYVGTDALPDSTYPLNGIVAGFTWNGVETLGRGSLVGDVLEVRDPFTLSPLPCPNAFNDVTQCKGGENTGNGGVTQAPELRSSGSAGNGNGNGGILITSRPAIRGFAGVFQDGAALVAVSGSETGRDDSQMITAFAVVCGILMALSAVIWAVYNCKPGAPAWCLCMAAQNGQYKPVAANSKPTIKNVADGDIPTVQKGELRSAPMALVPAESALPAAVETDISNSEQAVVRSAYRDLYNEDIPTESKAQLRAAGPVTLAMSSMSSRKDTNLLNVNDLMQSAVYNGNASSNYTDRYDTLQVTQQGSPRSVGSFSAVTDHMTIRNGARLVSMQKDANGAMSVPDDAKVSCFALSNLADFVVTGSSNGPPSIWELKTGNLIRSVDGGDLLRCAHGLHLACADRVLAGEVSCSTAEDSQSGMRSLQLWEVANGLRIDLPYEIYCQASCLLHNDVEIACAAIDRSKQEISVLIWNIMTNQVTKHASCSLRTPMEADSLSQLVASVQLHASPPDDEYLLLGLERSDGNQEMKFLSFSKATLSGISYDEPAFASVDCYARSVALLPNGVGVFGSKLGDLLLYDLRTMRLIKLINTAQLSAVHERNSVTVSSSSSVMCLAVSTDFSWIASGHGTGVRNFSSMFTSNDRIATEFSALRLWQIGGAAATASVQSLNGNAQLKLFHILLGHSDDVADCTFSNDNEYLISGSRDGSIRMWRVRDGSQVCWFVSNVQVMRVRMTHSMHAIIALGEYQRHRKLIMLQLVRQRTKRTQPLNN